jgi:hypothetical protein
MASPVQVWQAWLVAAALAGATWGQAPKVERRAYAHLQELRTALLEAYLALDDDGRRAVAAILAAPDIGGPFRQTAEALARARGGAADAAAWFRAGVMSLVLPEVVDLGQFDSVYVTMNAPRVLDPAGPCRFEIAVRDADGEVVRSASIDHSTEIEDLLRYRATTPLLLGGLPDGRYVVEVRTLLDGEGPRPGDWLERAPVWVCRSFKERVLALPACGDLSPERRQEVEDLVAELPDSARSGPVRAILNGVLWQVERAFRGEPRMPGADPVADLARAEQVFANVRAGAPPLQGVRGRLVIGLPVGGPSEGSEDLVAVSIELAESDTPRPLVLVVPGSPVWNRDGHRPSSPASMMPGYAADWLARAGFDRDRRFHLVEMESPGRIESPSAAVPAVLRGLRDLLPLAPGGAVLVGEREAAWAVCRAAVADPKAVAALVLVCAAPLSRDDLAAMPDTRILAIAGAGHPSTASLLHLVEAGRRNGEPDRVRLCGGETRPWPIALPLAAAELEAFVAGG